MPTPVTKHRMVPHQRPTREQLQLLMQERILVLDGAYGSAFQKLQPV